MTSDENSPPAKCVVGRPGIISGNRGTLSRGHHLWRLKVFGVGSLTLSCPASGWFVSVRPYYGMQEGRYFPKGDIVE